MARTFSPKARLPNWSALVYLPDSLTSIGAAAFYNCTKLKVVEPFLPDSVTTIGNSAFYGCSALGGEVVLGAKGVTLAISGGNNAGAFQATGITSVKMRGNVATVPVCSFFNCPKLAKVELSPTLTTIADKAFNTCPKLKYVYWQKWVDTPSLVNNMFGQTAKTVCHYFPGDDADGWLSYLKESAGGEALDQAGKATFAAAFPGARMAKGTFKFPFANENTQYYGTWNPIPALTIIVR